MECKEIQQWLITDYLDNELAGEPLVKVEDHLKVCAHCRELLETARQAGVASFPKTEMRPEPGVWQKIQDRILAEKEREAGWLGKLLDGWRLVWRVPQPVFRLAFVMSLVIAVLVLTSWPLRYSDPAYAYIEEQASFLSELKTGNPDLLNGDLAGYDAILNGT